MISKNTFSETRRVYYYISIETQKDTSRNPAGYIQ